MKKKGAIYREEHVIQLKCETPPIKPKESLRVKIDGMQIMRMEDHFVWNLTTITEEFSISIELLGGLTFDQFEVRPRAMHHRSEVLKPPTPQTPTGWKLKIEQTILPYQGIEIRWAPRKARAATSPGIQPSLAASQG